MSSLTISTPIDLIGLTARAANIIGVGQTLDASQTDDCFRLLNLIVAEWQINKWLIYDLVQYSAASTGATSYTVGSGQNINTGSGPRPDRVDAVFARKAGVDWTLRPFMSREGYDRITNKSATGIPESFFYDATMSGTGNLYLYPVPDNTYTIFINAKAPFLQYTTLTQSLNVPAPMITALFWNLAADIRPIFGEPEDPQLTARKDKALQALANSIAQIPQVVGPEISTGRQGIYSITPTVAPGAKS